MRDRELPQEGAMLVLIGTYFLNNIFNIMELRFEANTSSNQLVLLAEGSFMATVASK